MCVLSICSEVVREHVFLQGVTFLCSLVVTKFVASAQVRFRNYIKCQINGWIISCLSEKPLQFLLVQVNVVARASHRNNPSDL